jgi:hypothetical protein
MSDGFLRRFIDNFGKIPPEKPPLVPQPIRIPFFVAMSVVALVLLVLLLWLVVFPAIRAGKSAPPAARSALPAARTVRKARA